MVLPEDARDENNEILFHSLVKFPPAQRTLKRRIQNFSGAKVFP